MKKMKRIGLCLCFVCLTLGVFLLFGCSVPANDGDYTVRVVIPEGEYSFGGAQVIDNGTPVGELTDDRVLDIRPGQSVRFALEVNEGMILDLGGNVKDLKYEDGFVTVEDIMTPTTVELNIRPLKSFIFNYAVNESEGGLTFNSDVKGKVTEGSEITMTASVIPGRKFLGYSIGNYLSNGGTLVSDSESYSFTVSGDFMIYANYGPPLPWTLNYHANGGELTEGEGETLTDVIEDSFYYCPNTRPDKGYFVRDGYVLTGYNTEPDGSGEYHGLGWNVLMPDSFEVDLYCMWEKAADEADFEYDYMGEDLMITEYKGDADYAVIPESIGGEAVKIIGSRAFNLDSLKEVYIPKTVYAIAPEAFYKCEKLEIVNLSDSVTECFDDSFFKCGAFKTLKLQAMQYPHFDNMLNSTYAVNYERIITRTGPKMVIVSGSCNVYGLVAKELEDALDNKWDIITYSTVASTPCTLYAELANKYINEGDILMFTPEASPNGHQWGRNFFELYVWQIFECAYDALSEIDISNYTRVFSSFSKYNKIRLTSTEKDYETHSEHLNEYGEYVTYRTTKIKSSPWIQWRIETFFTDENVNNFNRVLDDARAKGATTMIGWLASTNTEGLHAQAKDRYNQVLYMETAKSLLHAHFFGDVADYVFDPKYVFDSEMHLTTEGCALRTQLVIRDVKAALTELGLYSESEGEEETEDGSN